MRKTALVLLLILLAASIVFSLGKAVDWYLSRKFAEIKEILLVKVPHRLLQVVKQINFLPDLGLKKDEIM